MNFQEVLRIFCKKIPKNPPAPPFLPFSRSDGGGKIGEFAQKMYDYIEGLHIGEVEDKFGYIEIAGEY